MLIENAIENSVTKRTEFMWR